MKNIQQRALNKGIDSLYSMEEIALLTTIKFEILEPFKSFRNLKESVHSLEITEIQRLRLNLIFDIISRYSKEKYKERFLVSSPSSVYQYLKGEMEDLELEEFRILLLDAKNKIMDCYLISKGSLTASIVHPREVFKIAIQKSAYSIIAIHNHPSGNSIASNDDIAITKRLSEVSKLIGIPLLDHVIIGKGSYSSLKEDGYL